MNTSLRNIIFKRIWQVNSIKGGDLMFIYLYLFLGLFCAIGVGKFWNQIFLHLIWKGCILVREAQLLWEATLELLLKSHLKSISCFTKLRKSLLKMLQYAWKAQSSQKVQKEDRKLITKKKRINEQRDGVTRCESPSPRTIEPITKEVSN